MGNKFNLWKHLQYHLSHGKSSRSVRLRPNACLLVKAHIQLPQSLPKKKILMEKYEAACPNEPKRNGVQKQMYKFALRET